MIYDIVFIISTEQYMSIHILWILYQKLSNYKYLKWKYEQGIHKSLKKISNELSKFISILSIFHQNHNKKKKMSAVMGQPVET